MRRKLFGILTLFMLSAIPAGAQDLAIVGGVGLSTTNMDDMKYLQETLLDFYPVECKIISSFPAYTTASLIIMKQLTPYVRIGGGYVFTTTGAKSSYIDFSGSITTEYLAISRWFGGYASYAFLKGDHYDLSVYGRAGANINRIEIISSMIVLDYSSRSEVIYNTVSPSGSAGLEFYYHFHNLSLGLEGGYRVDIPGKLSHKDSGEDLLDPSPDSDRVLTSDWSGWRAQAKIAYWLGR